jgi:hypothetical protein
MKFLVRLKATATETLNSLRETNEENVGNTYRNLKKRLKGMFRGMEGSYGALTSTPMGTTRRYNRSRYLIATPQV